MPGLYAAEDYDLAGFALGAVEREALLPRNDIAPGDVILGLASSGLHSNGYSLVRRVVERSGLSLTAPAPFDTSRSLGEALLTPTKIYVKAALAALRGTAGIKAFAHITGGGLTENIPRVLPAGTIARLALASLPTPPVFRWLARTGEIAESEMLRTFNCGVGFVIVADAAQAEKIAAAFSASGESTMIIGEIVAGAGSATTQFAGQLALRE
jgi:phosphoribosylformylglycinamidine cyclo-ligase